MVLFTPIIYKMSQWLVCSKDIMLAGGITTVRYTDRTNLFTYYNILTRYRIGRETSRPVIRAEQDLARQTKREVS